MYKNLSLLLFLGIFQYIQFWIRRDVIFVMYLERDSILLNTYYWRYFPHIDCWYPLTVKGYKRVLKTYPTSDRIYSASSLEGIRNKRAHHEMKSWSSRLFIYDTKRIISKKISKKNVEHVIYSRCEWFLAYC